jgi:hypothetical protein
LIRSGREALALALSATLGYGLISIRVWSERRRCLPMFFAEVSDVAPEPPKLMLHLGHTSLVDLIFDMRSVD